MNSGFTYKESVSSHDAGITVVEFYARHYIHSTSERWRERLESGQIRINEQIPTVEYRLKKGDRLSWKRPPWQEPETPRNYGTIHCDAEILAVDKPAGLPVLPDGGFLENTLLNMIRRDYPSAAPAHRLGRGTSGVMIFTLTQQAARNISEQFRKKSEANASLIEKVYHAITPPTHLNVGQTVEIDTPIGPVPHAALAQAFAALATGKPAHSHCTLLISSPTFALWEVRIQTGRPHQIRIHMASIGLPLLGDPFFLPGGTPRSDALPGDIGYYLRSISITLRHPSTSLPVTYSVKDRPDDFPLSLTPREKLDIMALA